MKRTFGRMVSILFAALVLSALLPSLAFADAANVARNERTRVAYPTLEQAVGEAQPFDTITLFAAYTLEQDLTVADSVTLAVEDILAIGGDGNSVALEVAAGAKFRLASMSCLSLAENSKAIVEAGAVLSEGGDGDELLILDNNSAEAQFRLSGGALECRYPSNWPGELDYVPGVFDIECGGDLTVQKNVSLPPLSRLDVEAGRTVTVKRDVRLTLQSRIVGEGEEQTAYSASMVLGDPGNISEEELLVLEEGASAVVETLGPLVVCGNASLNTGSSIEGAGHVFLLGETRAASRSQFGRNATISLCGGSALHLAQDLEGLSTDEWIGPSGIIQTSYVGEPANAVVEFGHSPFSDDGQSFGVETNQYMSIALARSNRATGLDAGGYVIGAADWFGIKGGLSVPEGLTVVNQGRVVMRASETGSVLDVGGSFVNRQGPNQGPYAFFVLEASSRLGRDDGLLGETTPGHDESAKSVSEFLHGVSSAPDKGLPAKLELGPHANMPGVIDGSSVILNRVYTWEPADWNAQDTNGFWGPEKARASIGEETGLYASVKSAFDQVDEGGSVSLYMHDGAVAEDITVRRSATLEKGASRLAIAKGFSLHIASGATLTNKEAITVEGAFTNDGALINVSDPKLDIEGSIDPSPYFSVQPQPLSVEEGGINEGHRITAEATADWLVPGRPVAYAWQMLDERGRWCDAGNSGSSLPIDPSLKAGVYAYRCVAVVEGLQVVSEEIAVTVTKAGPAPAPAPKPVPAPMAATGDGVSLPGAVALIVFAVVCAIVARRKAHRDDR